MGIETLKENLPSHARDTRLNLGVIFTEEGTPDLTDSQRFGIGLACAYMLKNNDIVQAIQEEAGVLISDQAIHAAQSAAMMMAMNNIYYRFIHFLDHPDYTHMPPRLRMNVIGNPGIEKKDFELYALAVSALNGCCWCVQTHAKMLEKEGVSQLGIQSAVRIASVLQAVDCGLKIQA